MNDNHTNKEEKTQGPTPDATIQLIRFIQKPIFSYKPDTPASKQYVAILQEKLNQDPASVMELIKDSYALIDFAAKIGQVDKLYDIDKQKFISKYIYNIDNLKRAFNSLPESHKQILLKDVCQNKDYFVPILSHTHETGDLTKAMEVAKEKFPEHFNLFQAAYQHFCESKIAEETSTLRMSI